MGNKVGRSKAWFQLCIRVNGTVQVRAKSICKVGDQPASFGSPPATSQPSRQQELSLNETRLLSSYLQGLRHWSGFPLEVRRTRSTNGGVRGLSSLARSIAIAWVGNIAVALSEFGLLTAKSRSGRRSTNSRSMVIVFLSWISCSDFPSCLLVVAAEEATLRCKAVPA
jgi:hypothetical protein